MTGVGDVSIKTDDRALFIDPANEPIDFDDASDSFASREPGPSQGEGGNRGVGEDRRAAIRERRR